MPLLGGSYDAHYSDDDDSGSESGDESDFDEVAEITPEDYIAAEVVLGAAAHGLKQRTFALRLAGRIDLPRGSQLAGAAELADSVRLLLQQGIRYQVHPEDQPEVLNHVLIQLRYLNQHTGANFDDEEEWNQVGQRLNALGAPSYELAQVIINTYLPAVEEANELAQAEAALTQAVQALFDAFLLIEPEDDSEEESSEEDSEEESEGDDSEEGSDEEDDSSEYSESGDSSDSYESDEQSESGEESSEDDSSEEFSDDLSGYTTDVESDCGSFDDMGRVSFSEDEEDFLSFLRDEVGEALIMPKELELLGSDSFLSVRPDITLAFPSSSSFCRWW